MTTSSADHMRDHSAGKVELTGSDRRIDERFIVPVDVELNVPDGYSEIPEIATLRNISTGGIGLEHQRSLRIGEIVGCRLLDTPADVPNEYSVEILWNTQNPDGTYLSGGRFV